MQTIVIAWIAALLCTVGSGVGGCGRREAKVEIDLSTPRSAATVFTRAVESGDADAAKSAAYAGGIEVEWVEAMASAVPGMKKLVAAAQTKFGSEANSLVLDRQTLNVSESLRNAEVQMDGSRATIIPGGEQMKLPMKNVDGKWKIDVGALTRGQDIANLVKELRAVGQVTPQLARDVEAGRFKTVKEIQREMGRQVVRTVYGAPATAPVATPIPQPPPEPSGDI